MVKLNEIDSLEIFVLMDNVADPFSKSNTGVYWNESQYQKIFRNRREYCGKDCCRACNGLSLLIRMQQGQSTNTILFDTGPDAGLAVENAKRLGLNLKEVDAIILSHGHFDHYGGTISALQAINKPDLPVYVHPELFLPRAFGKTSAENELIKISYNITKQEIEEHSGKVIESKIPTTLFNNTVLLSGEVPRITAYESGLADEFKLKEKHWKNVPEVIDEQCVIFNLRQKGLVVITGCGHTGIINATKHATNLLNSNNIYVLMGGFHLAEPTIAERIEPTLKDLQDIQPNYIVSGHCTGRQTQAKLSQMFGKKHIAYSVGARFLF